MEKGESYEMEDRTPEPDEPDETEGQDETEFGGVPTVHYTTSGPKGKPSVSINLNNRLRLRDEMVLESHRKLEELFTETLNLEPQCVDPAFLRYLSDRRIFILSKIFDFENRGEYYELEYLGEELNPNTITDQSVDNLRTDIRKYYDEWQKSLSERALKRAGIATAVGLSVIAIVTGLSVGLTRKGSDIVHQAKKWEKLHPASKGSIIPWTVIEKAGGKTIILTGEYLVIILSCGITYYVWKKR